MNISSSFQTIQFTAVRLSVSQRPPASTTTTATPAAAADRLTLSSGATASAATAETAAATDEVEGPGATPAAEQPPVSRTQRRADVLFSALDADQDGSITEQEFTEGAVALLRQAGERRRAGRHGGRGDETGNGAERSGGDGRESRRLDRLERKLEKAFSRVDANDDGAIDKDELTTALAQVADRPCGGGCAPPPPPEAAPDQPSTTGTTVSFSFSYVSIAVQRYTSLQPAAQNDTATATAIPSLDGANATAKRAA